ncbi:MAG TPA: hypothetical protein VI485_22450 [Vicinamibacterales bacterium]|nr:hypothetical protein [Vicinamibacterales bacterium]
MRRLAFALCVTIIAPTIVYAADVCTATPKTSRIPQEGLTQLLGQPGQLSLQDAIIVGAWTVSASARADLFTCERCCFDSGIRVIDTVVRTALSISDSTILGVTFLKNATFDQPFTVRRSSFEGGVQIFSTLLRRGANFSESVFRERVELEESASNGLMDLSKTDFWQSVDVIDADLSNSVHWEYSHFHAPVALRESVFLAPLILRGARISREFSFERSNIVGGVDFRFSRFGGCDEEHLEHCDPDTQGILAINESTLTGPLWLQSAFPRVPRPRRSTHTLEITGSSVESLQGKTWSELRDLLEPTLSDIVRERGRRLSEVASTLSQLQNGFERQGLADQAAEVEIYRRHVEALQSGLIALTQFHLLNITSGYGQALWRLPAWCITCVLVFACGFRAKRGRRSRTGILEDLEVSTRLFMNLTTPADVAERLPGGRAALRWAQSEQVLGFISLAVTTTILGTFIAK